MKLTNDLISSLKPSATLAVKTKASQLKAAGREIVNLGAGEPDFDTPDFIKDAAIEALRAGYTKYTPVPGLPALRSAIAQKISAEIGSEYSTDNIVVTNGGKQAIHECLEVVLNPGDEVIIPAPFWVSYPDQVLLAGGKPVVVQTGHAQGYKMTADQLEAAITDKTRMLIINSPSNPTGAVYNEQELLAIAEVVRKHSLLVLSDEVYDKLLFPEAQYASIASIAPDLKEQIILINAFSKTYAMTGWRIGYAVAAAEIAKAIAKFQSQTTSNVSTIAQHGAIAALSGPQDFIAERNLVFNARRKLAAEMIEDTPGISLPFLPDGAFYLFIRIDEFLAGQSLSLIHI